MKSLYSKVTGEVPPKTHNLIFLLNKTGKQPVGEMKKFIIKLNTASVGTRYPDNLEKIQAAYTEKVTQEIIQHTREVLTWIKSQ